MKAVAAWSDAHRWHLPLLLWLEPKDDIDGPIADLLPLTGRWDLLEAELRSVFARDRIFTPDQLRGTHPNLPAAIASDGWPTLGQLRGKLLFALLDSGAHRDDYLGSAQNLQGRLLFVASSTAEDPFAALFKINDAQREADRVRQLVQRGFIVTSNVDDVGGDDATNAAKLAASLAAGIHFGSSDRPAKLADRDYFFDLPDGNPARCNPVFPAARCSASDIEALSVP